MLTVMNASMKLDKAETSSSFKGLSIFNPLVGVESAVSANYGGFLVRGNLISFELVEVNGYRDW